MYEDRFERCPATETKMAKMKLDIRKVMRQPLDIDVKCDGTTTVELNALRSKGMYF